ncbi:MAG: carboxypeptidase-like regulatory domain-containing protein [Bryobacteraceae bacterium]
MRRLLFTSAMVLLLLAAVRAQSGGSGSIAGRVVDATSGAPLHRARVEIHVEGHTDIRGLAPSDGDGRFRLRALPAGQYRIEVSRRGYGAMAYGARRPYAEGRVIALGAGEHITDLTIGLPRLGVITGTVTGADGEPLAQAWVQALRRQFARGKLDWAQWNGAQTDDKGGFRLSGVMPGRYLVSASKQFETIPPSNPGDPAAEQNNRLAYTTTYAPGTPLRHEAREIVLQPGQSLEGVEIAMLLIRPVKLGVQAQLPVQLPQPETGETSLEPAPPPQPRNQPFVQIHLADVPGSSDTMTHWGGGFPVGGRFDYPNLQPGKYVLSGEVTIDGRMYVARQEVDLSGGELEVTLPFAPAFELRGSLRLEGAGTGAAADHRVFLVSGENSVHAGASAQVQPDGTFVLPNVHPGLWDIGVEPLPKGGYLKSMTLGDEDVLRKDMVITAPTSARLAIVLSAAGAELSGQVDGSGATTVLLAPQGDNAAVLSFYAVAGVDEKGAFHFRGLTPGVYKLYAFDDMEQGAWMDPNFLTPFAEQGTAVELQEGPNAAVTVPLIHNAGAGAKE